MTEPQERYARLAARLLARRDAEPKRTSERDRGVGVVAQAMAARHRRRRIRAWVVGLTGTVTVLALVAAAVSLLVRPPNLGPASAACVGDCAKAPGTALIGRAGSVAYPPGSHLRAGDETLTVAFGAVTRLDLASHTELVYEHEQNHTRFLLLSGSVRLRVEKLHTGQRFVVEAAGTQIEVRGTLFEVALASPSKPECRSTTRVRVIEGAVEVRAPGSVERVSAGQSWPSDCAPKTESATAPVKAESAPLADAHSARSSMLSGAKGRSQNGISSVPGGVPTAAPSTLVSLPAAASASSSSASSTLAAQNDLYQRAVSARQSGRLALSLELHDQLIERFPGSPLVESAMIERIRILGGLDRARAAHEARRYISRFPNGFARGEAQALLTP